MNRILSKEIMKRSRLRNEFLKSKSEADKKNYIKQRNYCMSLLRRTKLLCLYLGERNYCVSLLRRKKKEYCGNLDPRKVADILENS